MASRCKARNAAGNPCSAHVYEGQDYCRWHDPARASERRQWAVKGGRNKATSARLRKLWSEERLEPAEVTGLLSAALIATYQGELEPGVLSAIASAARALVAVHEATEVEARLAVLEAAAQHRRGIA